MTDPNAVSQQIYKWECLTTLLWTNQMPTIGTFCVWCVCVFITVIYMCLYYCYLHYLNDCGNLNQRRRGEVPPALARASPMLSASGPGPATATGRGRGASLRHRRRRRRAPPSPARPEGPAARGLLCRGTPGWAPPGAEGKVWARAVPRVPGAAPGLVAAVRRVSPFKEPRAKPLLSHHPFKSHCSVSGFSAFWCLTQSILLFFFFLPILNRNRKICLFF